MITDLIFILQQEHYSISRFIRFCYSHFPWWGFQKRQTLDWTLKVKLLLGLYVSFSLIFAVVVFGLVPWWIMCGLGVLWLLAAPLVLVLCLLVLQPLEYVMRHKKYRYARRILDNNKVTVVGITGSYGKSSMKDILATVLSNCDTRVLVTPGNINTTMGVAQFVIDQQEALQKCDYLIIEMGAYHIGNIAQTATLVRPDYSFLTAVGPVHIERFGSIANIKRAKSELAQHTKHTVFVNQSAGLTVEAMQENGIANYRVINKDAQGEVLLLESFAGIEFDYEGVTFRSSMLAAHNVDLIIMAIMFCQEIGIDLDLIQQAVLHTKPFEHRLEPTHNAQTDVWVLDDSYNGNKAGFKSALEVLNQHQGRTLVMTPGIVELGDLSKEYHQEIAQWYIDQVDKVLLIASEGSRYMREYFDAQGFAAYVWYESAPEAHADLPNMLQQGDAILFSNDLSDNYC